MRKLILIWILSVFLLFSCTTLTPSERPSWIDMTPEIPGEMVFISSGQGGTEMEARSNAVLAVLEKMGKEIGYSLEETYFRELFTSKVIVDLAARIADEFSYEIDGEWNVYVAVTADEDVFDSARSLEYLETQKREEQISSLISSSLDCYKDNRDMEAVENILKALLISLEGEVRTEEYSSEKLVDKAVDYLSKIRIESAKPSRNTPSDSLEFRVVRTKGLLYPVVEECIIECNYEAWTIEGESETLSYLGRSNSKGRVVVNRTNPYSFHSGTMVLKVHIDDDLMFNLSLKAPKWMMEKINNAIEEGALEYSYSFPPRRDSSTILVALAEYNLDGSMRGEEGTLKSILERVFASQELELKNIVFAEGEEESDNIESLLGQFGDMEKIYIIRMGVVSRIEIGELFYSRTEGKIIEIIPKTGERKDVSSFHYCASGKSEKEADDKALLAQAEIICGFLLGEF